MFLTSNRIGWIYTPDDRLDVIPYSCGYARSDTASEEGTGRN